MLNRELSLTFTSESDIIKLQRYELYDNRYRIFGNIASFMREVLFIVDFKENVKRIWGTTTKKKIVISAAALAVVAAGGITTGVVVNHQKDSNQSITMDAEKFTIDTYQITDDGSVEAIDDTFTIEKTAK